MQTSNVIIVGAGPTGLMLANQLTRFGIDYIIIDQKAGPTDQFRALVVHAKSMEIYQQLGLSAQILANGQPNDGLMFYKKGKLVTSLTLTNPGENLTPFPFMMMYEQSKNETLLYNNLKAQNKEVQWNTHIDAIEKTDGGYTIKANSKMKQYIFTAST